ncbi:hypothetical protein [Heyndrickxia vini]|uniref:Uncharacterized protein n=1 Tax=Heyndrickxia vini TaxID=1476025 RepID=A0ABX7DZU3_9BACI|nr:hypothetical protein [Heyndrickxia vini]QQZ08509.1 hypothetical protein I5776_15780 [Heyndrickxia vini]
MLVNVQSGDYVDVCFQALEKSDVKKYGLTKRNGWFDWEKEFKIKNNLVFGLFVKGNTVEIQGVIAIQEWHHSQMIYVKLMESAPQNKRDFPKRKYAYSGNHLLCFAMDYSFTLEFEGYVGLFAKKNYNEEYYRDKLGATLASYQEGRPFYFFDTDKSEGLLRSHFVGGVTICPN